MFYWNELTTNDFAGLDPEKTIAILPIAATEQHGPHLPVATDSAIAIGMVNTLRARLPQDLSVLVLPVQEIGKSNEHLAGAGTLTQPAEALIGHWTEIGRGVARAGLRKLVIVNSHGGNAPVMDIVARQLRVELSMLAVTTQWNRFGTPAGLFEDAERQHGVHAGAIETSLMLSFRPDLVRMENVRNFVSSAISMADEFTHLRPIGPHGMGWIVSDINEGGAVGDATKGVAEKGAAVAAHQVDGFIELLRDVEKFPLSRLDRRLDTTVPGLAPETGAVPSIAKTA